MHLDTSFDNRFEILEKLNWLPWIGDSFQSKRVLLVGESHYDDKEGWLTDRAATRNTVNNQGLNSHIPDFKGRKIFSGIEKTLLNKNESSFEERNKIWRNVAFFNLVQRLLPSIKERPNDKDFDIGWQNFLEVVDIIRPDICVKYGYHGIGRLGYLLHNNQTGWIRDDIKEFDKRPYCLNLTKTNYKLRIIFTHHPSGSRGFNFAKWAEHIRENYPNISMLVS